MIVTYDYLIVLALMAAAIQFGLLSVSLMAEFSRRKAHPAPSRPILAPRPEILNEPEAQPPQISEAAPAPEALEERPTLEPVEPPSAEPLAAEESAAEVAEPELSPRIEPAPPAQPATAQALPPEPEVATPLPSEQPSEILPAEVAPKPMRLGLAKTRESFLKRLRSVISGGKLDEICEGLEEALIASDVGVQASLRLVEGVRSRLKGAVSSNAVREALKAEIAKTLQAVERPAADPAGKPLVIMMVGVNGVGKTTTVAKLASRLKADRGNVIVAAADTFRAAAIEQLEIWCNRAGAEIIKQKQGSDPAAVAFDAVKAAVARNAGAVLIDTAGRLQTKVNLMEELKKVARVIGRELPGAPHETWLVLDANTGQNALSQARNFGDAVALTGVVLAKLDSTAKGGVIVAIADQLKLPVRFVGVGEELEDLRAFDPAEFVEALLAEDETAPQAAGRSYAA